LIAFCIGGDLQELVVEFVFVAGPIVLLQAGDQARIILEDHVFEDAALGIVEHALLAHLAYHGEEHAGLGPHVSSQQTISAVLVAPARLLREALEGHGLVVAATAW